MIDLKEVLPHIDTSEVSNFSETFGLCGLPIKNLPKLDTSAAISMRGMFLNYLSSENFKERDLVLSYDTSNVTDMNTMFAGAWITSLKQNFDTSKVTRMDEMFRNCKYLKELDLSNFNTENVISMDFMFLGCSSLKELDLSNFKTPNVVSIAGMFSNCTSLKYLDISNFDTSKVTSVDNVYTSDSPAEIPTIDEFREMIKQLGME